MPVLLGALASGLIGVSDYFGRYASRRAQAMTAVGTAFAGGLAITMVLVLVVPSAITVAIVLLGRTDVEACGRRSLSGRPPWRSC